MTDDYLDTHNQPENTLSSAPFAGRQAVFARIQQYLTDPSDRHALLFIGRQTIGKSALLLQCQQVFGDNVIGCYLSCADVSFADESEWLTYLIHHTRIALDQQSLNVTRLPDMPDEQIDFRQWLTDVYFPALFKLIRPHRRLLWLMDDVEGLIIAVENHHLPDDTFEYLFQLRHKHLQLGIVITLAEQNESLASQLTPLVAVNRFQRLQALSAEETAELIPYFVRQSTDSANTYIYNLTDGHPLLLQFIGDALQSIETSPITKSEVEQVTDRVYAQVNDTYRTIWQKTLSQNERLVLTAISELLYDDPLINLTTQRIESWLLETDFPLDITSINAGIRGLEYQNLVVGSTSDGIRIRAQLFQRWLIENARMGKPDTYHARPTLNSDEGIHIGRTGLILIVSIVIVVIILVAIAQQSNTPSSTPLQPTVTLGSK